MEAASFLYHDVVGGGTINASGFSTPGAGKYKLSPREFKAHLEGISQATANKPISVFELLDGKKGDSPVLLTFDDGGVSAFNFIADVLEQLGWKAHFFITTDYIGTDAFLNPKQICDLRARGHIIGTHSCSHPERISALSWDKLIEEWESSIEKLSDILGEKVEVGSIPGGYYSPRVVAAANQCGLKALFTSEPIRKCFYSGKCLVLGRYAVTKGMSPKKSAALVRGEFFPRVQEVVIWNLKKIFKALGGKFYLKIRKFLVQ